MSAVERSTPLGPIDAYSAFTSLGIWLETCQLLLHRRADGQRRFSQYFDSLPSQRMAAFHPKNVSNGLSDIRDESRHGFVK